MELSLVLSESFVKGAIMEMADPSICCVSMLQPFK